MSAFPALTLRDAAGLGQWGYPYVVSVRFRPMTKSRQSAMMRPRDTLSMAT